MKQGTVLHVCLSKRKGTPKAAVDHAVVREGHGLEGDAHAGQWHRQVSLLGEADIETMRAKGLELKPGAFGENLVVDGFDLNQLGIGTRLAMGGAEVEITQVGKVCHNRCAIYYSAGDCIMPRSGIFAHVLKGGEVTPGMPIDVVADVPRSVIQAAVLTVSDRCSAGLTEDTSGPAVAKSLTDQLQARLAWSGVVPDEQDTISERLREVAGRNIDIVLTVGGTGCASRDVTPEATRAVITREVPGLAEAMRAASAKVTPHGLLQRGVCGVCESTLVLNLPGSERAAIENLSAVISALPHAVQLLRGNTEHREADTGRHVQPRIVTTIGKPTDKSP